MASGCPVAFETKGTVRDARGLTSIKNTCRSLIAYCTFIRPITPSSIASFRVVSSISATTSASSEEGGRMLVESPECTPASSTCCITPPMTQRCPSETESTSTSVALLRNSSIRSVWLPASRAACMASAAYARSSDSV